MRYVVSYPFVAEDQGELSVSQGQEVTLLEVEDPSNVGWLLVKTGDGRSGFVPRDFLQEKAAPSAFVAKAASRMSIAVPPAAQAAQPAVFAPPPKAAAQAVGMPPPAMQPVSQQQDQWAQRDRTFGAARNPIPPQRRFFYRDLFGDLMGPFNAEEMRQRVQSRHVQADTPALIEIGSGAVQAYDERPLQAMFPDISQAFAMSPIPGAEQCWYYVDDVQQEQGPFSSKQMRLWLDDGYFASTSRVRPAQQPQPRSLSQIFPDPMMAFMDKGGAPPPAQRPPPQQLAYAVPAPIAPVVAVPAAVRPVPATAAAASDDFFFDPFGGSEASHAAPPKLQAQASGKALLQEAFFNAGPAPSAALSSSRGGDDEYEDEDEGGGRGRSMTYEDTLDLFDRVGLEEEVESPAAGAGPAKPAKPVAPIRIYGSAAAWAEVRGIPDIRDNPSGYATAIYNFFTRPLNPALGKVFCFIKREIEGVGHINYNKFTLFLEQGPTPLAVAFRHSGAMSTTFEIKMLTTAREDNLRAALTVAKLDVNFLGTQFILHNGVPGHQGRAKDLCVILYEKNRLGNKGPRKMKVGIPDIERDRPEFKTFPHGGSGSNMLVALQSINMVDLVPFINKPPKWNAAKGAYSLDFGGRVSRASVKNFQLVDAVHDLEHVNVCMQHGRIGQDKFTMDVQHPFSLLQAFGICLSSLHQKKAVD